MAEKNNGAKSSKTAHVMNLLNKGRSAESTPAKKDEQAPLADMVPPANAEQLISDQIKGALEEELGADLPPTTPPVPEAAPEPTPEPVQEAAPEPTPEPVQEAVPEPTPEPVQEAVPEPTPEPVQEAAPEPTPEPVQEAVPEPTPEPVQEAVPEPTPEPVQEAAPEAPTEIPVKPTADELPKDNALKKEVICINVMQVLVEERAQKYIDMFGLCKCPRCTVDVKALALTSLPAKYVVMNKGEMVPRITIYESRYTAAITAQIMQACKAVMESPRHDL